MVPILVWLSLESRAYSHSSTENFSHLRCDRCHAVAGWQRDTVLGVCRVCKGPCQHEGVKRCSYMSIYEGKRGHMDSTVEYCDTSLIAVYCPLQYHKIGAGPFRDDQKF